MVRTLLLSVPLLLGVSAAAAQDAGEAADREAALFGGGGGGREIPPAPPSSPGREGATPADLDARMEEAHDRLALGGDLYLRLDAALAEGDGAGEADLSSPSLVDLYLDARPTTRLRAYVAGRLRHDFTLQGGDADPFGRPRTPTLVALDQLWLKFDVGRRLFVTAGRQHLKFGSGHFWNPTDFLSRERRDPLAILDERLGVALLKLHLPLEDLGWNFYVVANLEGASRGEEAGLAGRAEFLLAETEVALLAAFRKDQPLSLGLDLSSAVGPFDVHGEMAVLHGLKGPFFEGDFDPGRLVFPTEVDREDDWVLQAVGGAEVSVPYSDEDSVTLGAEYFYNEVGYDGAGLYPWLLLHRAFSPFYNGRHYAAAYVALPAPGNFDFTHFLLSGVANLSDRSALARLDFRVSRVLGYLDVNLYAASHFGREGEFRMGLRVPPLPGATDLGFSGLEKGLTVPPPRVEAGAGLQLRF